MTIGPLINPFNVLKRLGLGPCVKTLLVASVSAGLLGCAQRNESQADDSEEGYPLIGVIESVDVEGQKLIVEHEEIPGYMPAMTMQFDVGAGDVKVLKAGDRIRARMVRDEEGNFGLIKIWKIDDETAAKMREVNRQLAKQVNALDSGYYLAEGDTFPAFALLDQYGEAVTPERYAGKPFMLNFIFTRCTDGDMCPLSTSKMASLQRMAEERGYDDLEFISVTLDPKFDTPGVLRAYADAYGIDGENFRFVTGEREAVQHLIRSMAVTRFEDGDNLIHSLTTVLVDREGKIVLRSAAKAWKPEEFLEAVALMES